MGQLFEDGLIGGSPGEGGEVLDPNPAHLAVFSKVNLAVKVLREERDQSDGAERVLVADGCQGREGVQLDAELLRDFPAQRFFRCFSRFAFPPRKLPEPGETFPFGTAGGEDPVLPIGEDQAGDIDGNA